MAKIIVIYCIVIFQTFQKLKRIGDKDEKSK